MERDAEMRNTGKSYSHSREPLDRSPHGTFNPDPRLKPIPERERSPYGLGVSRDVNPPPNVPHHV